MIHHADVLDALRAMPDNSFHGCLTDPPYGLSFMGHQWDHGVPSAEVWREVLRVLRPGAALLAFGGTRTFHRLTCAIEDAGFEVRDCLMWLYGSGFPKSHDVSKAIDREAGAVREVVGQKWAERYPNGPGGNTFSVAEESDGSRTAERTTITAPATEAARQWEGHGTALKPAWEPIILARKPLEGTVAANVQRWGCGALAIDASRVGTGGGDDYGRSAANATGTVSAHEGFGGKAFKIAERSGEYASALGRWPANVILSHSPDCVEVGTREVVNRGGNRGTNPNAGYNGGLKGDGEDIGIGETKAGTKYMRAETVTKFNCAPGCPVAALDAQTGNLHGAGSAQGPQEKWRMEGQTAGYSGGWSGPSGARFGDSGGASRFFYCAKASRKERDAGLEGFAVVTRAEQTRRKEGSAGSKSPAARSGSTEGGRNIPPTVKPIALTTYLARLILPPVEGSRLLVPFCGSGSEMLGGTRAGWSHVEGIDSWDVAVKIARERTA